MKKIITNKAFIQTGIALVSMIAVAAVVLIPSTIANQSNADTVVSVNNSSDSVSSVSNSGNSSSNSTTGCTTGCVYAPLSGYCDPATNTVAVGTPVIFTMHPTGGTGYYSYSWYDSVGTLTSDTNKVSVTYSTPGTKTVTSHIISDGKSLNTNCSVTITNTTQPPTCTSNCNPGCTTGCVYPQMTAYCDPVSNVNVGTPVIFTVHPSGGTGYYSYSWRDSQGVLTSDTNKVSVTYSTPGVKTVTSHLISDGKYLDTNCTVTVNQPVVVQPITATCVASATVVNTGTSVTFTANASGSTNGNYAYAWDGTDGMTGSSRTINHSFNTAGSYSPTVTVTSNGQTVSATCNVTVNIVVINPPVSAVCVASVTNANIGDTVTYTVNPVGGTGNYTYSWRGTDNVSGTSQSMSHVYNTSGSKVTSVTVYSNGQQITANCNVTINVVIVNNPLNVVCYANPTSINVGNQMTWTATANGGNDFTYDRPSGYSNNYTYSWTGSDNLYGNGSSIYHTYNTAGSQYATVTVTSNGQTVSATCNGTVNQIYVQPTNNLSAYCVANPSTINVGQSMNWVVYPSGGNSNYNGNNYYNNNYYTYSWNGSDGLYGNNSSVNYTYQTQGTKTATVTVYSNGQQITANCTGYVQQQYIQPIVSVTPQTPINPSNGVYLSAIPATGISNSLKTSLFVGGMFIWSAFMSYIFLSRRNAKLATAALMNGAYSQAAPISASISTEALPVSFSENIGDMARAKNILLSHDAMNIIAERANGDETTAGNLISTLKASVGNNESWTTINKTKLEEVLG